jgi:D-alanine-D-alanine ligase
MEKLTLALLSGGISSEREVSLNSGEQVYEALDKNRYDIRRYDPKTDLPRLIQDACSTCLTFPIRDRGCSEAPWP